MKRRALISVTDKTGVVEFASRLVDLGFSILSTGGTFEALKKSGVAVEQIADYTGFPEILDGRVKTLHGKVHGGILGKRDDAAHQAAMEQHGIDAIDVVAVNLYRFRETAEKPGVTDDEVVENIDIGGPAMIRSAAKNHAHVAVVVDPADYDAVATALAAGDAAELATLRRRLAARAFAHTAAYDSAIAGWFRAREGSDELEDSITFVGDKVQDLRYGENPHQKAAFYRVPAFAGPHLASARQVSGKELSYNNLVDLDAALGLAIEFDGPACVIVKHTNPCGTAVAATGGAAFEAALASDPLSAFGGIVAFNRVLDVDTARAIAAADLFVEAIVANDIEDEAAAILQAGRGGKGLRLLALGGRPVDPAPLMVRPVHGGLLVQSADLPRREPPPMDTATDREPSDGERRALAFAWKVAKHTKSNAIVLAVTTEDGGCATVGVGAGQMSRVDSVKCAVEKAGDKAAGAVLASDAFFPFADGVETAARAGVTAVIQPGGSRNDGEVIAACNAAGVAMVTTGMRHFRH